MAVFHPTHNGDIVHLNVGGTRYGRFNCIHFVSIQYSLVRMVAVVSSVWIDHIEPRSITPLGFVSFYYSCNIWHCRRT